MHGLFRSSFAGKLLLADHAETLLEAINTTTGVHHTLLTSVEWVTLRANVQVDVFAHSRASLDLITARTSCSDLGVFWMDTLFHGKTPS